MKLKIITNSSPKPVPPAITWESEKFIIALFDFMYALGAVEDEQDFTEVVTSWGRGKCMWIEELVDLFNMVDKRNHKQPRLKVCKGGVLA